MSVTTTITSAMNDFLSRLSSQHSWVNKDRLIRGGKQFAALLKAISRGRQLGDVSKADTRGTLHVLSGRHRGARIELSQRSYLIGWGEDCDVVLRDEGIAERHCLVTLGRDGFDVKDLRSEDAQTMDAKRVTHADEADESEYDIGGVIVTLTQHRSERAPSAAAPSQDKPRPTRWSIPAVAVLGALLILTLLLGVQRAAEPASAEQIARLVVSGSEALAGRGFDSVRFRAGPGGGLEVTGFVTDLTEERRLHEWLRKENYSGVQVTVRRIPQLLDDVHQVLRDEALQVALDGRRLRIEGTTHQPPVKERIRSLGAQLQGLVEIDDRVVYTPAAVEPGPLPVRLRGVMLDEPRYFVTDSGARYFIGGVLPDGAEVVEIAVDGLRFQKDGRTLVYSLE